MDLQSCNFLFLSFVNSRKFVIKKIEANSKLCYIVRKALMKGVLIAVERSKKITEEKGIIVS